MGMIWPTSMARNAAPCRVGSDGSLSIQLPISRASRPPGQDAREGLDHQRDAVALVAGERQQRAG